MLGHPQPFFAPIAAAISLSTSPIQRSRRIAQMVVGVLLGIAVAEILHGPLGDSTAALGAIVLITMAVALAAGVGFFGDGMMFPNQAAASAVLVVTLHRHGTGAERALDAIIGGATAYLIGVLVFPAQPLALLRTAERRVLETLARRLGDVAGRLQAGQLPEPDWTLAAGHEIHQGLSALARARATARLNVRVAPRRFTQRRAVDAENRRTAQLDLLANAVISLIRSVTPRAGADALPNAGADPRDHRHVRRAALAGRVRPSLARDRACARPRRSRAPLWPTRTLAAWTANTSPRRSCGPWPAI